MYDLLYLWDSPQAKVRPFVAAGAGQGVSRDGQGQGSQPQGQFALLTKTQQVEGLITVGGGVKLQVGRRSFVYIEDARLHHATPKNVIAPFHGLLDQWMMHGFCRCWGEHRV